MTSIYNFVAGSYYEDPDLLFSLGGYYSFIEDFRGKFQEVDYFEDDVEALTKGCKNEECKAKKIFNHLKTFRYELGEELNPKTIWERKYGDCDEMSYLYMTLLKSADINSRMQCSNNHCWNLVVVDDKRLFVDVVNQIWREY